jgi:hypothetical protein
MIPTDRGTFRTPNVFARLVGTGPASPGTTLGAWCGLTVSGSSVGYIGTTTKLYTFTTAGVFTDKSKVGGYTNTALRWSFAQYGNITLATNNVDAPQYRDASGAAAFADLAGAPSTAKIVTTQSNCVLFFNTNNGGSHYTISDVGDYTNYSSGDAIADNFISHRPGDITAAVAFKDDVIVAKANSIYRMTYVGGLVKWTVSLLADGIGCLSEADMVVAGDRLIITGTMGAFSFDGASFRDLMQGWNDQKTMGNADASVYWPYSGTVWFHFSGSGNVLPYNINADAWGAFIFYAAGGSAGVAASLVRGTPAARLSVLGSVKEFDTSKNAVVLVNLSTAVGATSLYTWSQSWGAASAVNASIQTHLYGQDDAVSTFTRLTPKLIVNDGPQVNQITGPAPPTASQMTLAVTTFTGPDGTGQSSTMTVPSSTGRKRFDFSIAAPYALFLVQSSASYFEIDDVVVKISAVSAE